MIPSAITLFIAATEALAKVAVVVVPVYIVAAVAVLFAAVPGVVAGPDVYGIAPYAVAADQ